VSQGEGRETWDSPAPPHTHSTVYIQKSAGLSVTQLVLQHDTTLSFDSNAKVLEGSTLALCKS
jgi:hypothetical protein